MAQDLDEDPEHLSVACMQLLSFSEMKKVWERGDSAEISNYSDNYYMRLIEEWDFEKAAAESEK